MEYLIKQEFSWYATDLIIFIDTRRYYFKATEESLAEKCDDVCRKRLLCNIVMPHSDGQAECMEVESDVDGVILPKRIFEKIRTTVLAPLSKTMKKVLSVFGLG